MQSSPQQTRILILIGSMLLFILAAVFIVLSIINSGKVTVNIIIAPSDANFTIDGQTAQPGKVTLTKTKHTLKATRQYFTDASKTIDAATIDPKQTIYLLLAANTTDAQKYLLDHPDQQHLLEQAGAQDITQYQGNITKQYPVLQNLPYETIEYKIDYTIDNNRNPVFNVILYTPTPTPDNQALVQQETANYKAKALQYLQSNGVDTNKTTVNFSNY